VLPVQQLVNLLQHLQVLLLQWHQVQNLLQWVQSQKWMPLLMQQLAVI
jgi:hypothetical protein